MKLFAGKFCTSINSVQNIRTKVLHRVYILSRLLFKTFVQKFYSVDEEYIDAVMDDAVVSPLEIEEDEKT